MSERKPYPSDLSDERWALIEPVITAWKAAHPSVSGHQGSYAMREIINTIFYQGRTGCQWDYLPHDLPPRSAVSCYFARWRDDGTDQAIHDLLRWQAREQRGRLADPSLVVPATQSVHAAAGVPASTTGNDAGKRVHGRKRGLAVDVLGLVVAVAVLAASAHENTAGIALAGPGRRAGRHCPHGAGGPGVQERGHRPWRHARHQRADRRAQPRWAGVRPSA
jgi:transposase